MKGENGFMTNIDLPSLEKEIVIRKITEEDLVEVAALSINSFGPDFSFNKEQLESQVKNFPEGQICIEYKGRVVGSCSSLIVNFKDYTHNHSYTALSDNGYIRNHNPEGQNLYGVEVSVHPDYRKLKIGRRLYNARKQVCKDLNLKSIIIGGRIPNYYKYSHLMSAQAYAEKVLKDEIYDPVMTFQKNNGFVLREIIPNYLPDDEASRGYATSMEWINEDYTTE